LFDVLFHILPLGTEMDKVDPTLAKAGAAGLQTSLPWDDDAMVLLDECVQAEPVLVRISAAKRVRDRAERDARRAGEERVTLSRIEKTREDLFAGVPA
jgi:chlorophyllide a reductase subunit Z